MDELDVVGVLVDADGWLSTSELVDVLAESWSFAGGVSAFPDRVRRLLRRAERQGLVVRRVLAGRRGVRVFWAATGFTDKDDDPDVPAAVQ